MSVTNKTPVASSTTSAEVQARHHFSVKDLKKVLENIDDDMIVTFHRVEDSYFEGSPQNGWCAIKALWDHQNIREEEEKEIIDWLSDPEKCDQTQHEIIIKENKRCLYNYIDAIPAFQAYVAKEKGADGKKVLVITAHY